MSLTCCLFLQWLTVISHLCSFVCLPCCPCFPPCCFLSLVLCVFSRVLCGPPLCALCLPWMLWVSLVFVLRGLTCCLGVLCLHNCFLCLLGCPGCLQLPDCPAACTPTLQLPRLGRLPPLPGCCLAARLKLYNSAAVWCASGDFNTSITSRSRLRCQVMDSFDHHHFRSAAVYPPMERHRDLLSASY